MANKNINKVENNTVNNTTGSVTTDVNVSRETSVQGSTNNVGQEIKAMGQDVVTTPTMTEEEHKKHMETMYKYGLQGRIADMSLKVEIKTAYDKKEHLLDGYDDTSKAFYKWAEDKFELKETQVKQAVRVIPIFGKIDDKGYWSMDDKYKVYGLEKLDRIQSHPKFKLSDFDSFTEVLGISEKSTVADIKAIVARAKGKETDPTTDTTDTTDTTGTTDTTDTTGTKTKDTKPLDISAIKSSDAYKEVDAKRDMLLAFISDHMVEAKKIVDSKKNDLAMAYITKLLEDFKKLESDYQNVNK